jgi:hypothetical protein
MKHHAIAAFFVLASVAVAVASAGEPVEIFNGKNLDGWKVDGAPLWSAHAGVLTGQSNAKKQGSVLWTEKKYRDFTVEFEFRMEGKGDSGVFLRALNEQIQIGISRSLKRDMTGSPYIGSKSGYPAEAKEAHDLVKYGEWIPMKIEAKAGRYQIWIHGKKVMDYQSDTAKKQGPIGLQVHPGVKMKIEFRRLKVTELP